MANKRRRRRRSSDAPSVVDGAGAGEADIRVSSAADGARRLGQRPADAPERFAALDLGSNNCRLLIASPRGRGFRVFDAFSRIVRLGEGMSSSGALSDAAMARTIEALMVCAEKIARRNVTRQRCIATQACRGASNGEAFLARVRKDTGLEFEIISPAEEARLAVTGCAELFDATAEAGLIFDIGGGSTEISWVTPGTRDGAASTPNVVAWTSMPIGVVNLSERFGGRDLSRQTYDDLVATIRREIASFGDPAGLRKVFERGSTHFLGTSGTVTSIAGVHLKLPRYRRDAVDGLWLTAEEVRGVTENLRVMNYDERAAEPCIGAERADLVVVGCAILDALLLEWPTERIRVADRGLREGILAGLVRAHNRERDRRRGRRRRSRSRDAPRVLQT
jgi:exopolyphosphatase/guanosine-5'-triphosphate,3'-diphosphate pyrophosphatase